MPTPMRLNGEGRFAMRVNLCETTDALNVGAGCSIRQD